MTAEGRLRHVTLKIARAKEHEADLNSRLGDFLSGQPYRVGVKGEQESRRPVYFVKSAASIPDTIPLVAGDAIQNLMSALDHLAYQLVCRATNDAPPRPGRIYFPIADDAQKYDSQKRGKMQGVNDAVLQALDDLKP